MKLIKTILYLIFLVPLTIATAATSFAALLLIYTFTLGDGWDDVQSSDYIQSEEFMEMIKLYKIYNLQITPKDL